MSEPNVYADSTALIGLARIGRLDLLALYSGQVMVTSHVWLEITETTDMPGVPELNGAREQGLLVIVDEGDPDRYPTLDPGESTVLSAAVATRAHVIMDERKARRLIETDPDLTQSIASVTGVLGLILLAKEEGHIPAVRPLLDALIRQDFRIGRRLFEELVSAAGER
ncbi:MAG: DUF3368 domain-containing protein [Thermomicrobiales bacterium]